MYDGTKAKLTEALAELEKYKNLQPGHRGTGEESPAHGEIPEGADVTTSKGIAEMLANRE
jgi:hypothetical protein